MNDAPPTKAPGISSETSRRLAVKNKAANAVQITAEQLLREAVERQAEEVKAPRQRIVGADELDDHRAKKRKDYEDSVRRNRHNIGLWLRYADWEAVQGEFRRARSCYERALHVDYQNTGIWLKYIEMEMSNKFINSARNLFDRVTGLLPRMDQFWFKYAHMEEMLGNYAGARAVFERWMAWEPEDKAWAMFAKFEERCRQLDRARGVLERWVSCLPSQSSFLKMAVFEERHRDINRARGAYEKAIELLSVEEDLDEEFFLAFAEFETRQREYERTIAIYEQALARLPRGKSEKLSRRYLAFQKQRGDETTVQKAVLDKRRLHYESLLREQPLNLDHWFDLLRLEEAAGDVMRVREVYERAVAQVPSKHSARAVWKRYVYLWLHYALFEEVHDGVPRARTVWHKAVQLCRKLRFAKLWIYAAEFEARQGDLKAARSLFAGGATDCPKAKLFKAWAALELRVGDAGAARKVHLAFIEALPELPLAWTAAADLEVALEDEDRARAFMNKAIAFEGIKEPHLIWKHYIDMEGEWGEYDKVRALYERLLEKTEHFKVYKALSEFEFVEAKDPERGRAVLKRGMQKLKEMQLPFDRKFLVDHWYAMELQYGTVEHAAEVAKMKPKAISVRRKLLDAEGKAMDVGKAFTSYVFPDDEVTGGREHAAFATKAKEMLKRMKQRQATAAAV